MSTRYTPRNFIAGSLLVAGALSACLLLPLRRLLPGPASSSSSSEASSAQPGQEDTEGTWELEAAAARQACHVGPLEDLARADEPGAPEPGATAPRLFTISLPEGDSGSINVGWTKNGAEPIDPAVWLAQGYQGARFVGAGMDKTHVRCTSWDGTTLIVRRRAGLIVRLQDLTIHAGSDRGSLFGEQNLAKEIAPGFRLELVRVRVVVDPPFSYWTREHRFRLNDPGRGYRAGEVLTIPGEGVPATFRVTAANPIGVVETPDLADGAIRALEIASSGNYTRPPPYAPQATTSTGSGQGATITLGLRPKWGLFGYNADLYVRWCEFECREAVEHALYWHGLAQYGALVQESNFNASGAEELKFRGDATETAWAGPEASITIRGCTFRDWFQPWSWRGGAAVVVQGGACDLTVEQCEFWGGAALENLTAKDRCKGVMVSSEGDSYDAVSGAVGTGFGNGWVVIRQCVATGSSEVDWQNTLFRCGRNGGSQFAARGYLLEDSGLWGLRMIVQAGDLPTGRMLIRGCNGQGQIDYAGSIGMATSPEATFPTATRKVPLSEGIVR